MEAVAKHDFTATADDELSFSKGEILKVLSKEDDQNWYKAEIQGKEGFVPNNYIEMKPHEWFYGSMKRQEAEKKLLEEVNDQYIHPDGAFLVRRSESAPADFSMSVKSPPQDNSNKSTVQHFKILRDGIGRYFLWVVKFNSINALIDYHRTSSVSRTQSICLKDMKEGKDIKGNSAQKKAFAMYEFKPQEDGEIYLKKGDEVLIEDQEDRYWWRGTNCRTKEMGLFPANYIQCI